MTVIDVSLFQRRLIDYCRRLWHSIGPRWLRDLKLVEYRCRELLPDRISRWTFVGIASARRLFGNTGPIRLNSAVTGLPIVVRPFSSDLAVAVELFIKGDYDSVRLLADTPKTILDFGANIGLSVRLWQMWYPAATILALEPNPDSSAVARLNIDTGPQPDAAKLLEAAIGPIAGTVHLAVDDQPWSHHTLDTPTESTIPVRSVTVANCLAMLSASTVDLCKCDIEGDEAKLFADCESWIGRINALAVETHSPYDVVALEADLRRNGSNLVLRHKVERGNFWLAFFTRGDEESK